MRERKKKEYCIYGHLITELGRNAKGACIACAREQAKVRWETIGRFKVIDPEKRAEYNAKHRIRAKSEESKANRRAYQQTEAFKEKRREYEKSAAFRKKRVAYESPVEFKAKKYFYGVEGVPQELFELKAAQIKLKREIQNANHNQNA